MTFLFTDIEGSTLMVQRLGDRWADVLARHDNIVTDAIDTCGGRVVKTDGDSFFAVFEVAMDAVRATVEAQKALASEPWPEDAVVKVRMGIHTGVGALGGSDYFGLDVHRAARIADAGHGGQVIMSEATAVLVGRSLPDGTSLHDLGKHRFKDLSDPETIFQLSIDGLPTEFGPLRTLDSIPNNLPAQLTSFVGREAELAEAVRLLEGTRILTLTGAGGTGKTRLALQIAAEVSDQFSDGVYFIDLSPAGEASVVPSTILRAMGFAASYQDDLPEERLIDQLRGLEVLLVVDNFEHVVGAAPILSELVRSAPRVKLVVTSRVPLRIAGEQEMPVPPLASPRRGVGVERALESEGVRLLVERTQAVRPDFRITPGNVDAVVDLVSRLDGLPLAIELVASRLRLFPVETVLERLDTRMLSTGSIDVPERQRTIRNTIAWSYDLLDPEMQRLFRWLSVLSGWSRLEEIEALFSDRFGIDALDGMERLVDHSLVITTQKLGSPWFRVLYVIREFARERLHESGEHDEVHAIHCDVYLELVRRAAPELTGRDRLWWLDLLEDNHDNIRSAIEWGMEAGETDRVLELVSSLWRFWQTRGHLHEAQRRIESALAMPGGSPALYAKAMEALGGVQWWRGQMETVIETYGRVLEMQRELGESRDLGVALYNYGLALGSTKEMERGLALLREGEELFTRLGDEDGLGDIEWGLGNTSLAAGDFDEAYEHYDKASEYYKRSGNEFGVGWSLFEAGLILATQEKPREGWAKLEEALRLFAGHRDVSGVLLVMFQLAGVALILGDRRRAYRLVGVVDALRAKSGADIVGIALVEVKGVDLDRLDEVTGEDLDALNEGRAMDLDRAIEYALAGPVDV
ncbi:MAG TPA: adenylate/guanylate cyclase domain-containing protein [Acidimicrobiia bacterium]